MTRSNSTAFFGVMLCTLLRIRKPAPLTTLNETTLTADAHMIALHPVDHITAHVHQAMRRSLRPHLNCARPPTRTDTKGGWIEKSRVRLPASSPQHDRSKSEN